MIRKYKNYLLILLVTLLNGCHPEIAVPEEVKSFTQQARKKAALYFDFKTGHFKPNITEQEKQQLYNDLLDSLVTTKDELYRLDRTEPQPFISPEEQQKRELTIQTLADRCVQYIGEEPEDKNNKMLTLKQGDRFITTTLDLPKTKDSEEILSNIQNNYLQGRVYKCSRFLYGDHYSLASFEYYDYTKPKTAVFRKKQMLEPLYEDLYFAIKEAGLLRTIPAIYYPKSAIRHQADSHRSHFENRKLGLTEYIEQQEKLAHKPLNHELLAIELYGSREKWLQALRKYYSNSYHYPNGPLSWLCKAEIGKVGMLVRYTNYHGNMTQMIDTDFLSPERPKCQRRETDVVILDNRDKLYARILPYFSFDLKSNMPKAWEENFTKEKRDRQDWSSEQQQFFNDYTDLRIETTEQLYRFDRAKERTMFIADEEVITRIGKQLDHCAKLIGKPPYVFDTSIYAFFHGISYDVISLNVSTKDLYELDGKLQQCTSYIYGEHYQVSDFNYPNPQAINDAQSKKRKEVEALYEASYLEMRQNGLLRRLPSAFYPKSLVRAFADQTGLTGYIEQQQKLAGKKLPHDELAAQYFGSYAKWVSLLDAFIQSNYGMK